MAGLMATLRPRLETEECERMRQYLADSIPTSSIPKLVEVPLPSPSLRLSTFTPRFFSVCFVVCSRIHARQRASESVRPPESSARMDCSLCPSMVVDG
eukprot:2226617-Rhodomonas_salina.1